MSAGALFGTFFNFFAFATVWALLGYCIEIISKAFNLTITLIPTFQDAVNGFHTTQVIYGILPVIAAILLAINYVVVESSNASKEV